MISLFFLLYQIIMIQFIMIKILKIELFYFAAILLLLALVQHPDLLSDPMNRLDLIIQKKNFLHPFLWSFGVYIIVFIFRLLVKGLIVLKKRLLK